MAAPKIWRIPKSSNGKNGTLHRRHTNFDLEVKTSALLLLEFGMDNTESCVCICSKEFG